MKHWELRGLDWRPHNPEILTSSGEGRAIVLDLTAGETLHDHEVHEGAWITLIDGAVTITDRAGEVVDARVGTLVYLKPKERHEVIAVEDARLLLVLTPWPGDGHPGAMTLEEKAGVRDSAARRAE